MEQCRSMKGYFEHIGDKTYLDKYPSTIIKLEDLRDKVIVEFGSGVCNDAYFLLEQLGADPKKLFLVEEGPYYFIDGMNKLEGCDQCPHWYISDFCPDAPRDRAKHCQLVPNMRICNILEWFSPMGFADFVYANNFLHTLGYSDIREEHILRRYFVIKKGLAPQEAEVEIKNLTSKGKIKLVLHQSFDILKDEGTFFGRTLSDYLDVDQWKSLQDKPEKSEAEWFVVNTIEELQRGKLIGISPLELESYAKEVGFGKTYTEIKPTWKPIRDFYFRFEK